MRMTIRFLEAAEVADLGDTHCTICMNLLRVGDEALITECTHFFHRNCVNQWFQVVSLQGGSLPKLQKES